LIPCNEGSLSVVSEKKKYCLLTGVAGLVLVHSADSLCCPQLFSLSLCFLLEIAEVIRSALEVKAQASPQINFLVLQEGSLGFTQDIDGRQQTAVGAQVHCCDMKNL
jgi:hypothetical protein